MRLPDGVRRRLPAPVLAALRRWRTSLVDVVTRGEFERLRSEMQDALDQRTRDLLERSDAVLAGYDRRVAALANRVLDLEAKLGTDGPPAGDADRILAAHRAAAPLVIDPQLRQAFEDEERGPWEAVSERLKPYLPWLADRSPVLDLGGGRGELLALLRDAGVPATGVDLNADLFVHLAGLPEASVGAVTMVRLVEHVDAADADRLLRAVHRVLRPDGIVIVETLDPRPDRGADALWRDPTRVRLYHPSALGLLLANAGFEVVDEDILEEEYRLVARRS